MAGTSSEKLGRSSGTFVREISLTWALTLYMP
jgi:hypothetical protein